MWLHSEELGCGNRLCTQVGIDFPITDRVAMNGMELNGPYTGFHYRYTHSRKEFT